MNKNKIQIGAAVVMLLLLMGMVLVMVQRGPAVRAQEGTAVSGTVAPLLQYQGRLSDPSSGEALADGSYTMVFRLYREPSGGAVQWEEIKDVAVRGGLFSTVLGDVTPLDQALFNGQALWLGIKVGTDTEATPRQELLPVAYALSLVPGAAVEGNSSSAALSVSNAGSGEALLVDGDLTVNGVLSSPDIVTQYEFQDHVYGGMHNGRAIAYGSIRQDGTVASATGNVSSEWRSDWKCYMITIDGHTYDQRYYVTTVTTIFGIANAWALNGNLCVGIYHPNGETIKRDFHFVTFMP